MAISGTNRDEIERSIRNRADFRHANMSGERIGTRRAPAMGRLNNDPQEAKKLLDDVQAGGVTYVVFSYATPIAYVNNGEGVFINARYSPTTSHHQTIARCALGI